MAQLASVVEVPISGNNRLTYERIVPWLGRLDHEVLEEQERISYFGGIRLPQSDIYRYDGIGRRLVGRGHHHIRADQNSDYVICAPTAGRAVVTQAGREAAAIPGEFILIGLGRPFECCVSGIGDEAFSCLHIKISASALRERVKDLDDRCARTTLSASNAFGIMRSLVGHALSGASDLQPSQQLRFDALLVDAAAIAIHALDEEAVAAKRGLARNRIFEQACAYIRANLSSPSLDIPAVAEYCHVSPRYLQAIFTAFSATITGYILEHRLQQCRCCLESLTDTRSITAIAMEVGFNDMPYFSRAYRARFGASPTTHRSQYPRLS